MSIGNKTCFLSGVVTKSKFNISLGNCVKIIVISSNSIGSSVYMKFPIHQFTSFCIWLFRWKIWEFFFLLLIAFIFLIVLFFLCLHWSPAAFPSLFFDDVASDFDKVQLVSSAYNILVFGDFSIHYNDLLPDGVYRPGYFSYNCSILQNDSGK